MLTLATALRRPFILHCSGLLLFGLLCYTLFFHKLAGRDLWSSHEARAAQNAQSMLETGDWALPRLFDGRIEMQKPPLFYWLVAGNAWLRGEAVDAWAVRLPAALSAVACAIGLFVLCRRCGRPVAGLLAAVVLVTMLHYTWLGRTGRIDMPLTLAVGATLGGFHLGRVAEKQARRREAVVWRLLGYIALAAGILLKGPIALVLPVLVSIAYRISSDKLACRYAPRSLWWGVPLVLVLTTPWFLWANHVTQGEFVREFVFKHNLQRGLGGDETLEEHPWWHYGPRLVGDLFPWSLLLPVAGVQLLRRGCWREDAQARFGFVWLGTMVVFFSLMRFKRADYLLPAYPGAALLLGCTAERWLTGARLRRTAVAAFAATVFAVAIGWTVYVDHVLPQAEPGREQRTFAEEVRKLVPRPGLVLLFRTEAHSLVFHLGESFDRIQEWENLDVWACQPVPVYVIMPAACVAQWPRCLEAGQLFAVTSNETLAGGTHEEPLVLLCTRPVGR